MHQYGTPSLVAARPKLKCAPLTATWQIPSKGAEGKPQDQDGILVEPIEIWDGSSRSYAVFTPLHIPRKLSPRYILSMCNFSDRAVAKLLPLTVSLPFADC